MNELVSVIIPVYNTAKYLDKCIESVISQTYQNLQIILVDDGATDESPVMCDKWKEKDSRITVIHKQNEGLGLTRNAGLCAATGVYVCFWDSDDTFDSSTIEECVRTLHCNEADACYYGRKTQHADGSFTINANIPSKLVYTDDEVRKEFATTYLGALPKESVGIAYIQASACCAMYRRRIIENNGIRFQSERECLSEDTFFNLEICKCAKKVIIIPKDFYNYTYNGASLTKRYNPNRFYQLKGFMSRLLQYMNDFRESDQVQIRVYYLLYVYIRHTVEYEIRAFKVNGIRKTLLHIADICSDADIQKILWEMPIEQFPKKARVIIEALRRKVIGFLFIYYGFVKRS